MNSTLEPSMKMLVKIYNPPEKVFPASLAVVSIGVPAILVGERSLSRPLGNRACYGTRPSVFLRFFM